MFWLLFLGCFAISIALNPEGTNPDVQEVFNPHSGEESYQRRYVISVLNKAEDCYYIPEVRTNQIINFHFVVSLTLIKCLIEWLSQCVHCADKRDHADLRGLC